ncbi:MAG: ABC transporter substrate-binding protein [Chloroflexota bacterium]|nr:ABC transporter substrate-binding protein [Chloroflexota bacterium]
MVNRIRPNRDAQTVSRREFLRAAGVVGAGAVLLGACGSDGGKATPADTPGIAVDPPPETTTIRLGKYTNLPRTAPFFLAEQFLPAEGFTDVRYVEVAESDQGLQQIAAGEIDIGLFIPAPLTVAVDRGDPLVVLAGVHSSLFEIFGGDRVQSLRDLKGKRIAGTRDPTEPGYSFWAAFLAYVGIDFETEVEFVASVGAGDLITQARAGTIDVWQGTRPLTTGFRAAKIGHVLIDGLVDPPWSQYFMGMAAGNRDFVAKHPAATKRALRAILKATDVCAKEPERAARYLVDKGYTQVTYESTLDAIPGRAYTAWREFEPEDTIRFYALRLKEAGLVKGTPDDLIARATDWRYLNEIKRELAV